AGTAAAVLSVPTRILVVVRGVLPVVLVGRWSSRRALVRWAVVCRAVVRRTMTRRPRRGAGGTGCATGGRCAAVQPGQEVGVVVRGGGTGARGRTPTRPRGRSGPPADQPRQGADHRQDHDHQDPQPQRQAPALPPLGPDAVD